MALKDTWFQAPFDEAFPKGLYLLGAIEPMTEFQKDRNAPVIQKVDLDRDGNGTGLRLWKGIVTDPTSMNEKLAAFAVTFVSNVRPVPAVGEALPGMTPIELEGMVLKPKIVGAGEYKSIGWSIRATGIKGDTSGSKQAPADPGASRPGKAA